MAQQITVYVHQIDTVIRTRGYGGDTATAKAFDHGVLHAGVRGPSVTVRSRTDDQEDWQPTAVSDATTNPVKWLRPFNKADRDPSNALDDQQDAYREDYTETFELPVTIGSGLVLDRLAEFKRRFGLRRRGRWCQLEVSCSSGRLSLQTVGVEGRDRDRPSRGAKD